ncbi:hypothetical protein F5883DRAFT_31172 [Diaporthe sp. PMI_573]|nr:hypothetical protein F5883DRAFT_31172 [Diaporthaceae sp. PMI_573]
MPSAIPTVADETKSTSSNSRPNKVYYLHAVSGFSKTINVLDLTTEVSLMEAYNDDGTMTEAFRSHVCEIARKKIQNSRNGANSDCVYTLNKHSWFSSHDLECYHTLTGEMLAETACPISGSWSVVFPHGSIHSTHSLQMKPISAGCRQLSFVKDSTEYIWDLHHGIYGGSLYRVSPKGYPVQSLVRIGEFEADHGFGKKAVLLLNFELDEVVGIVTCAALMNRTSTFEGM